jgi:hypothetical protein
MSRQQYFHSTFAVGLQGKPVHLFESEVKLNYMRKLNSYLTENKTVSLITMPLKQILVIDKYKQF